MGSRRTTTRPSFGNGRSSNGDDVSGISRPGGCSYLSNVRPGNRSTLCSVMAQLTEETQPSFDITLKSKAVSENCNVKFSCVVTGYPAPQVTWYKDDMQLDRYCGLPKYELFRNGQSHSLHIYNCTVEDAAIYQASAINTKGIVSCSGVLEVGEMNEFKIHQRYFAKLKQKAENRHREAEGKENQEPLRPISPDRTQRKRRSTMEAFLSTPSSVEDEGSEENHQAVVLDTDARLQEATVEEAEEKPVPVTNGAVSAITNGQTISDGGSKGGAYIYDSTQKTFTMQQPKNPFAKKKIKISNSAKVAKADTLGERTSGERRLKEEASPSAALVCTDTQTKGSSVMEVENVGNSSAGDANTIEEHQKSATHEAMLAVRPSNDGKLGTDVTVFAQKKQPTASATPAAPTPTGHTASGTDGQKAAKHEKEAGRKETEKQVELQKRAPSSTSAPPQGSVASTLRSMSKEDIRAAEHVTAMDVAGKSNASSDGSLPRRHSESVDAPRGSRTALPQRSCEPAGDEPSEKEANPCQKNVTVSRPTPPSEVTQAQTKMNRNDAPVSLELPPGRRAIGSKLPQKTPIEREAATEDIQTSSRHSGPHAAIDSMTRGTRDHSRESDESHAALHTRLQKPPLESPGGGENTVRCNVSHAVQHSQADATLKPVEGTEIQEGKKVEVNEIDHLLVQTDSEPEEKVVGMDTEPAAPHTIEQTPAENSRDAGSTGTGVISEDATSKEAERDEPVSKEVQKTKSESQDLKSDKAELDLPLLTKTPGNTDFQENPTPETKVISVAELLRSQIKALESTQANPASLIPAHANLVQDPTTAATRARPESGDGDRTRNLEVKKSIPDRKTDTSIDNPPPSNIKATLMEVYRQLNLTKTDQAHVQTQGAASPPARALRDPLVIPPISVMDTGTTVDMSGLHGSAKKYKDGVVDVGQETEASTLVAPKDCSVAASPSESNSVEHSLPPLTSEDERTGRLQSSSNLSETAGQDSTGSPLAVKARTQEPHVDEDTKRNSKTERGITEVNMTTPPDPCKRNTSSVQSAQNLPTQGDSRTGTQEGHLQLTQQETSVGEECPRSDSLTNPTPEPSPSSKRRNCASPIPSATPQELASGARRKILTPKAKPEEATEATAPADNQTEKKEVPAQSSKLSPSAVTLSASPDLSRRAPPLQPAGEQTAPVERRSPLLSWRKTASETPTPSQPPAEEIHTEVKPAEKNSKNPFKAPQVIRKIRGENFADASGHLKLWCQFFNVLSDSTINWCKNEEEIAQVKRSAGDETQVNLAIVQASCKDSGVYSCSITNEYGTDSTDILLSADILAGMSLREDLGVGEEIEMTPLIFNKGVADSGVWSNKFFGRIMMKESQIGDGCCHKVWRAKVIYGLEPVFESGNTCVIKARNPIAYGGKEESCLIERNLDIVKQECKIQNLAREYCKIFSAEARVIESFGPCLEVIPVYLMYRPANTVPYATVETDLTGVYQKYSVLDHTGRIDVRTGSEVGQKCYALQHWIFQWTSGNLLLSRLEGVDTKITNVGISVKSTGHQGLSAEGNPRVFEQFVSQHKCNYFCGLLGLRPLKVMDSLMTPTKPKGSRSPLLQRKMAAGSSSPQTGRKAAGSPRPPRKAEQDGGKTPKAADAPKVVC